MSSDRNPWKWSGVDCLFICVVIGTTVLAALMVWRVVEGDYFFIFPAFLLSSMVISIYAALLENWIMARRWDKMRRDE